jgi:hypothetical protein
VASAVGNAAARRELGSMLSDAPNRTPAIALRMLFAARFVSSGSMLSKKSRLVLMIMEEWERTSLSPSGATGRPAC